MEWKERYADKLKTPQEGAQLVKSGDRVAFGMLWCTPPALCRALYERKDELEGVEVYHTLSTVPWAGPGTEKAFRLHTGFLTNTDRSAMLEGRVEYQIAGVFRPEQPVMGDGFDVFMVQVSPPDKAGLCSFGHAMWAVKSLARTSRIVIGEVNEKFVRTGGDNFIPISEIDYLVEGQPRLFAVDPPERTAEEAEVASVINTLVAEELIEDGDTVQIGTGTVSAALAEFLHNRHDLGIHSEVVFGGVPALVQEGVVNGLHKTLNQGKVVGTSFGFMSEEELTYIDGNPVFELYDMSYTNDIRTVSRLDRFVGVNNALLVDLTGQIAAESIGTRIHSGTGGQLAFSIGAQHSRGGRSVTVLPSSSMVDGERRSRIVPMLEAGTVVTVPRTYADIFVTEYGIARLAGKTLRQRVEELVAIARPDFRAELRQEARRHYYV